MTGGELQGRAGESLPSREHAIIGKEPHWERADDDRDQLPRTGFSGKSAPRISQRDQMVEIEYERGPGSRFQVEGRGAVRSEVKENKGAQKS